MRWLLEGEFVDQREPRPAGQQTVEIHFAEWPPPIGDLRTRQDFQAVDEAHALDWPTASVIAFAHTLLTVLPAGSVTRSASNFTATPALDTTAYLTAKFANADDAPLLPGEVLLHRDGVFVGKAQIGLTASGDQLDLGFGADDRIKIERNPVKKRENDPAWYSSSKYQLSDYRTVVTNLHARAMRVTIIDRIPVSENTAIVVEQLRETTQPTEKQVGDKRGVMAWSWEMQPNEKKEVRVAYRMKWPSDRDVRLLAQGGR